MTGLNARNHLGNDFIITTGKWNQEGTWNINTRVPHGNFTSTHRKVFNILPIVTWHSTSCPIVHSIEHRTWRSYMSGPQIRHYSMTCKSEHGRTWIGTKYHVLYQNGRNEQSPFKVLLLVSLWENEWAECIRPILSSAPLILPHFKAIPLYKNEMSTLEMIASEFWCLSPRSNLLSLSPELLTMVSSSLYTPLRL